MTTTAGSIPTSKRFVTSTKVYSWLTAILLCGSGFSCSEVRGRQKIQTANKLYKDGQYKEAVVVFEEAEKFVPDLPILWLNKGQTCRQMMIPGSKTPESTAAAKCALAAFKRYQELAATDSRGEMLFVQTLFDSDEFETLAKMYEDRFKGNPKDMEAVNGLIQVYSKWNKLDESIEWYTRKAELLTTDAEAQYAVGVFIWQQLMQKGGGPDKASFDPRPDPNKPREKKAAPPFGLGDLISQQRIDLADMGIKYLNKAIDARPKYHEAMIYLGLLYRQKSFALFDQPEEWQKAVDSATTWSCKAVETQGKELPKSCKDRAAGGAVVPPGEDGAKPDEAAEDPKAAAPVEKKSAGKKARKGKRGARK